MSRFNTERPKSLAIKNQDISYLNTDHAKHTLSNEEKIAFSMHFNQCLSDDHIAKRHLPIDVNSMELFSRCQDGLLLCRLINLASPDAIDERALNTKENLNVYQKTENINLAINAAKAIGCKVVNVGSHDILEDPNPTLVLGLVWQIIKIQLLSQITLQNFPELVCLLEEGEDLATFIKCSPETILLRWLNYHLKAAGSNRRAENFGANMVDSEIYSIVMHKIKPNVCPLINGSDNKERAKKAIENAQAYGAEIFMLPGDIVAGNKKLNMTFVAQLFNTDHGLNPPSDELLAELDLDDAGDSREERVLRMWINSLNIDDLYVNYLFADIDDGALLLKLIEHTKPGCIDWKRVNKEPKMKIKKVENCNLAVTKCGQELGLSMVNVGGIDIVDQKKKLILAIIVQLFRKYTLSVLATLAGTTGGVEITDTDIVQWANAKVEGAGMTSRMKNMKDKSLGTSRFFLELIAALKPQAVDWAKVTPGETLEEKAMNARYCLSSAMKIGAAVFLTPEDIMEVNSKMLVNFVASIWISNI